MEYKTTNSKAGITINIGLLYNVLKAMPMGFDIWNILKYSNAISTTSTESKL